MNSRTLFLFACLLLFPSISKAVYFGGSSYLTTGDAVSFDMGSQTFSVSLWFKTTTQSRYAIGNPHYPPASGWYLYVSNSGCNWGIRGTSGAIDITGGGSWIMDGNWHHSVGVWERSGTSCITRIYLDGVMVASATATIGDVSSPQPLTVGACINAYYVGSKFVGDVDNVEIVKRVITSQEAYTAWSSRQRGMIYTDQAFGFWPMGDCLPGSTVTLVKDRSTAYINLTNSGTVTCTTQNMLLYP